MLQATATGRQAIPAPRGVRNSATRVVASTAGVYEGRVLWSYRSEILNYPKKSI